jgi:hypothetical protein
MATPQTFRQFPDDPTPARSEPTALAEPEPRAVAGIGARAAQAGWRWLRLAVHPATVRRALWTAVVVGSLLIAINHGDAIWRGDMDRVRVAKILLTLAVPYLVSTVSSVSTRRELGHG